eukprot:gene15904-18899_t
MFSNVTTLKIRDHIAGYVHVECISNALGLILYDHEHHDQGLGLFWEQLLIYVQGNKTLHSLKFLGVPVDNTTLQQLVQSPDITLKNLALTINVDVVEFNLPIVSRPFNRFQLSTEHTHFWRPNSWHSINALNH